MRSASCQATCGWQGSTQVVTGRAIPARPFTAIMVTTLSLFCHPVAAAQRSGLSCISNLSIPVYGGLLWQAQLTGTVSVTVVVTAGGAASEITVLQSPHEFFRLWLPLRLKTSVFLPECAGRNIELTFRYSLVGPRREAPDNQVVVKSPGIFEITASPPILHQTID